MREITTYVGLIALMVTARYAPLERTGEIFAWFKSEQRPASPAVVTGSVSKADAHSQGEGQQGKLDERVRTILAQATSEAQRPPGARNTGNEPDAPRSRIKRDDSDIGDIFTGGTGLIDQGADPSSKQHALEAANPDDFLVICEAGCRPSTDRIVYRVSKVAAAAAEIAQRRMQPTAAPTGQAGDDNDQIVCVAGCYDDPKPQKRHAADASPPVKQAAVPQVAGTQEVAAAAVEEVLAAERKRMLAARERTTVAAAEKSVLLAANEPPVQSATAGSSSHIEATAPQAQTVAVTVLNAEPRDQVQSLKGAGQSVADLQGVHAISAETQAHLAVKKSRLAAVAPRATPAASGQTPAAPAQAWRTKVTTVVALASREQKRPERSVVALQTASNFETSISVENGWEWSIANNP